MNDRLNLVFDKAAIENEGVDFARASHVAESLRNLVEEALRFRLADGDDRGKLDSTRRAVGIALVSHPYAGSLKLPLWVSFSVAASLLGATADVAQISGLSLRDALSSIESTDEHQLSVDDVGERFARSSEGRRALNGLVEAAELSGCSYVAVEHGNQTYVVHGRDRGPVFSLIGSAPTHPDDRKLSKLDHLLHQPRVVVDVWYRGRKYPAFAINGYGSSPGGTNSGLDRIAAVVVWGSKRNLPSGRKLSVKAIEINAADITHGSDLPETFRQAPTAFFVEGAAEDGYE